MRNPLKLGCRVFKVTLLSAILLPGMMIHIGCRALSPAPFSGGIRISADTAPRTSPSVVTSIPGVLCSGRIIPGTTIPGGTGISGGFADLTNYAGVCDKPDSITNSEWQLDANYHTVIPGSGCVFSRLAFVTTGGLIYGTKCLL
jgi:hypothetical protein